jgi:hypothetical protein
MKVIEKFKIHIIFQYFFFENRAVYEIMWKNAVQPDRTQMTTRRTRSARWISNTANTHSEYVTLIALPLQQRFLQTRLNFVICTLPEFLFLK